MRKTRSDSLESSLTPERRETLEAWLFDEGISYAAARMRLKEDFGVTCSYGAMQAFYNRTGPKRLQQRIANSRQFAESVQSDLKDASPMLGENTLRLVAAKAFDLAAEQQTDLKGLATLTKLLLAARKQSTAEQALVLDEKRFQRETCTLFIKWAADQQAMQVANSTASNADKIEQLGQMMFGEDWKK